LSFLNEKQRDTALPRKARNQKWMLEANDGPNDTIKMELLTSRKAKEDWDGGNCFSCFLSGVNDIMFDSISSLDRTQVPRSVSMDALNWDEVV
jgi:hypothetical protein